MTPEEKEEQKRLEAEIATRIAALNKTWIDNEAEWKKFVESIKKQIAEIDLKREAILHPKE